MKLIQLLFLFAFSLTGKSQSTLDTSWRINSDRFKLSVKKDESLDAPSENSVLALYKQKKLVLGDTIFCSYLDFKFVDINKDGIKDFLVYESSGARSNLTYNLFIYKNGIYKRVVGFNKYPNVDTTEIKGVLVSTILTGTVEYKFLKLLNSGTLVDLNISEIDRQLDGDDIAYQKGIMKVKRIIQKK